MITKTPATVAAAATSASLARKCPPPATKLTAAQRETLTPFQIHVYESIMDIPKGKVTTYKSIATNIGCKSSQAIGQALKRNPYNGSCPDVPCHRVVKTDLTVGGLSGSYSNANKKYRRLADEGVVFHKVDGATSKADSERWKVDPSCVQYELN
mmetsp:Transcript_40123/g.96911  ORF Transcript_40123/g.96911 Transcript_40123/m.96911 type:complete len:154 (-) Transcript_40123:474-935(-)